MLKLTRLLHFHQPHRVDLLDYYERTLFNQMLGEQDPRSAHGFNIYYTGLSPAAFKRQPPFMGSDPDVYSTNYHNFSCDHATGMETQAKFADTIYSRDTRGLYVNLFIPSEVRWTAAGRDDPAVHRVPGRARHPPHGGVRLGPDGGAGPAARLAGQPGPGLGERRSRWPARTRRAPGWSSSGSGGPATGWTSACP